MCGRFVKQRRYLGNLIFLPYNVKTVSASEAVFFNKQFTFTLVIIDKKLHLCFPLKFKPLFKEKIWADINYKPY